VVNSNLVVLTDRMLDDIAASTLLQISVSLDAATAETYRKIRGADFATVTANVRRLSERLRASTAARRPLLVLNMTVMKENLDEVPMFIRLAKSLGADRAVVWPINDFGPDDEQTRFWETRLRDWHFVYRDQLLTDIPDRVMTMITEAKNIASEIGLDFISSNLTSEQGDAA
jgi:MoaA/NifB/PqqE/SkfB family radical SAM enzyme